MHIPPLLIQSLLPLKDFDEAAFKEVHQKQEKITSIRMHSQKGMELIRTARMEQVPWCSYGYYLPQRPSFTFDPCFHAGCYYVQEASSMFLEQALKQTVDLTKPLKVLDLCGAPGGKSTHIQSLISEESLLVSNEVIKQRVNILRDNIIKWGCSNVVITSNDPRDFSKLKGYFDVIVVDAPCSGSGLFRRDEEAIKEWSENNVSLCSQRQQRILADILPALKSNGILVYSTCSYSKSEDEDIVNWLTTEFSLSSIKLEIDKDWHITEVQTGTQNYGYRFWPHRVKGEGFFLSVFKKNDETSYGIKSKRTVKPITHKMGSIISNWVNISNLELINVGDKIYGWPKGLLADYNILLEHLWVTYFGTLIGEVVNNKLIPHHALAMSSLCRNELPTVEVDLSQAIAYLQRKNIELPNITPGWKLITYQNQRLGWVNVLPNRVNNYYPKELRILKETP